MLKFKPSLCIREHLNCGIKSSSLTFYTNLPAVAAIAAAVAYVAFSHV